MEIHTPQDWRDFLSNAGHKPTYLGGLINVLYLNKLEANPIENMGPDPVRVSYIDYTYTDENGKETALEPQSSSEEPMERGPFGSVGGAIQSMALKVYTKDVYREKHTLKVDAGMDPQQPIIEHIMNRVFDELLEHSSEFKKEVAEHFNMGLDLELTGDLKSDKRRVIARVLAAANMIASKGRRGPANFVMIGEGYLKYLEMDMAWNLPFWQLKDRDMYFRAGLEIFVSPKLGNKVIVGRCPSSVDEPALHLITTEDDITGHVTHDKMGESADVDITYALVATGNDSLRTYLQFDINEKTEEDAN